METIIEKKSIAPRLDKMYVGDAIKFPFTQRSSVEVTRTRYQNSVKGIGKKFEIETIDDYTFKVTRKI